MALPLLPLLALAGQLVPGIVSAVAGDKTGAAVGKVIAGAQAIFGTEDPGAIEAAIARDPALALQWRMTLVSTEVELRRIQQEELEALLRDVASARAQTVELAKAGSALAWMPAVISFVVLGLAFYIFRMVFNGDYAPEVRDLVNMIVGGVGIAGTVQVLNYWLGSTSTSKTKDQSIAAALSERK